MSKILIVYHSYHHGNTKRIAEAMAGETGAELCLAKDLPKKNLADYSLIGFGSGIAYSKHYDQMFEVLSGTNLAGRDVFVFSTSGTGRETNNSALVEKLKEGGAKLRGTFACKGFDTYGPFKLIGGISKGHPDGKETAAAIVFIRGLCG